MPASARQLAALADPSRRALFETIVRAPAPVAELAAGLPISRPAVSQHLRVLQQAGLITCERAGTRNVYRADPAGLAALRGYLDGLWAQALVNLKAVAEASYPQRRKS
ncbi:regulatory protein ArsR [Mizugakiibacter sediminis]|uniref:ArsR family transcriptional regulator n=1 Tax=Mizugakiibacter sediminis TaxID=1475481 RepID=A0A0K8QPC9_9GAMM|nr:metalloregulator ArsR/SmtB family transcription factor [Mizugakiibacter sediminis]GAP66738.1 regulatory protein ArsR [Mizugakiibacter sediminis]